MDSPDIREEEFWRFLKTIHILFLDLTSSTAQQEAVCKNQLALAKGDSDAMHVAENTWNSLLKIFGGQQIKRTNAQPIRFA